MSTATQVNDQEYDQNAATGDGDSASVADQLAVTQDTVTYAVYRAIAKEGQDKTKLALGFGIYKEGNDLFKSVNGYKDAKGNDVQPDTELLRTVTVTKPIVHTLDGIGQVVTDADEAAVIFMNGANQKLTSQLRSKLTATNETTGDFDFQGEEISYDECVEILNTPVQRRNLTEGQKAMKLLKGISPDTLAAVLKQMGYAQ